MSKSYDSPQISYWERRGSSIYTEESAPGAAVLIAELHGLPEASNVAQRIVDQHNAAMRECDDDE